jgi:hypothetical protein
MHFGVLAVILLNVWAIHMKKFSCRALREN